MRSVRHILFCLALCLSAACVPEIQPPTPSLSSGIELTLVCDDAIQTKTEGTEGGVRSYHENLISWVDLYFFTGKMPESNVAAWKDTAVSRLHYRMTAGDQNQSSFQMSLSGSAIEHLFAADNGGQKKMTVLAIANYPGTTITDAETPTFSDLDSIAVHADFVSPTDHRQDRFMMRGVKVLELIDAGADLVCKDTVLIERYASKMTVSVHVKDTVHLAVQTGTNDAGTETVTVPEVWRPMLDGMVIYMENGVNSVRLGGRDSLSTSYFTYYNNAESWYRFVSKDRQGNYSPLVGSEEVTEGGKTKTYYETYPMYMYPQCWEYGSVTSPTTEPDLKLIIPWYRDEYIDEAHNIHITPTQKQCYYKVIMPSSFNREFRSNYWYFLRLDVQILGALTDETPVTLTGDSYIVNWQNHDVVVRQAEVGKARYLSVDRDTWEISNLNELSIPYVSSHPLTIDDIVVTRPYFGNVTSGDALGGTVVDSTDGARYLMYDEAHRRALSADGEDWFSDSGSSIDFKHVLNNNYQAALFDYSPYTVTFRIKHADNEEYQQEVKIIQYPAIYISRIRNSDPVTNAAGDTIACHTAGKDTAHARSTYYGFTFVDGAYKYNETDKKFYFTPGDRQNRNNADDKKDDYKYLTRSAEKKEYQWRAVYYTGGSIDMYNIHISVLPSNFDFVVGDPRVTEVDNLGYQYIPGASDTMLVVVGGKREFSVNDAMFGLPRRKLTFYYPTEASERTRNMLAPSYRVCSKFGGVEFGNISLEYARYRCAAYQEDGFPAGRWRLPTQAEVSFIAQLSANGAFEVLFNNGGTYWSANGAVTVNTNGVTPSGATAALLRCVYDSWYWGEDQSEYDAWRRRYGNYSEGQYLHEKFVWGDRPR